MAIDDETADAPPTPVSGAPAGSVAQEAEVETMVPAVSELDLNVLPPDASLQEYVSSWIKRVRGGESGILPVLLGLIVIIIVFQVKNSVFLSARNLVNLLEQSAEFIVLGMAEIFVLLLGEIDLSLGYSGAVGAAVMAILAYPPINLGWPLAIGAGLLTTTGIGFVQGQIITRLRLPSFIVTLAGLLFWEGFLIWLINNQSPSNGGSIQIENTTIYNIVNGTLGVAVGWISLAAVVGLYALVSISRERRRRSVDL